MNNQLDSRYHCRPITMDDLEAAVDLFNAESRWLVGKDQYSLDDIRTEWNSPDLNLATDTLAVFNQQNQPVGYAEFWGNTSPHVRLFTYCSVHPHYRDEAIAGYLTEWLLERGRQNVSRAPEGARVTLEQGVNIKNTGAAEVLTRYGFQIARHFFTMRVDLTEAPVEPQLPEGIVIRSIANEKEEKSAIRTAFESFRDHWGWVEQPFEEYYQRWKYRLDNDKEYDPALYFIAEDGDEIAGISLCYPKMHEDPNMAWVGTLGVRRPWRKRGLGEALLKHSFAAFYQRGKLRAGLAVDATSLTGATRLYERAGMYIYRRVNLFAYELRPGEMLITQSVEA